MSKIVDNRDFILVIFDTGSWWNNLKCDTVKMHDLVGLIKTVTLLSQVEIIFGIGFYLTLINLKNSLFYNSKQHFKFFKSLIFYFLNLKFVNVSQNLSFNSLLLNFRKPAPTPSIFTWMTHLFRFHKNTEPFSNTCLAPCFAQKLMWEIIFSYVSRWNRSTVLLNL